jgi:NIMA (never in mitosis gene a)-related kinase
MDQSFAALEEINLLGVLDSQFIVKYIDSFVDEKSNINIVMEFCANGDLHTFLDKRNEKLLSENIIWKFFIQICLGIHNLHSKNVLHRDLKTLNIFLMKDNSIRIGDLGLA